MKLIGVVTGTYEGNNWAKLVFTEPVSNNRSVGQTAVVSKASYNYVMSEIFPQFELYKDQDVTVSYDRFGRVQEVRLV